MSGREGPSRPLGEDAYRAGQEQTRLHLEALEALREDVAATVRREVEARGLSQRRLEEIVRDMVGREIARQRAQLRSASGTRTPALAAAAAAGIVLLALGGWLGYRAGQGGPGATGAEGALAEAVQEAPGDGASGSAAALPPGTSGATATAPEGDAPGGAAVPAPALLSPAQRGALYDSLLATRSPRLTPLVDRVEAETRRADLLPVLAAWRAGPLTQVQRSRLHDALVQLVLRDLGRPELAVDGFITRSPCEGTSCPAVLASWRAHGEELGYPVPASPGEAEIRQAEKLLVLSRLEGSGR